MTDAEKTQEQLITELVALRRRIAELESSEAVSNPTEENHLQGEKEKTMILNSINDLVAYLSTDMKVLWANKAASESVDRSIEELKGRHC
jgi:PAS domain-containing protein